MKLLDTVMDALNSIFPELIRTPAAGDPSGTRTPDGQEEGVGFAATLVQFLGGKTTPVKPTDGSDSSVPLEGSTIDGSQTEPSSDPGGKQADESGTVEGRWAQGNGFAGGRDSGSLAAGILPAEEPSARFPRAEAQMPVSLQATVLGPQESESAIEEEGRATSPSEGSPGEADGAGEGQTSAKALDLASDGSGVGPANPDLDSTSGTVTPTASSPAVAGMMDRNPENLDPEFRDRLGRVMERMEKEFGHRVRMVEGYRSSERQAHLFEQGRTRPGPVVTWTQESLHSQGRAADLQVDGSWENPQAYARLQRVAQEEGLQTLGAKDAGHVQLRTEGETSSTAEVSSADPWTRPGGGISRPARVARVAAPSRTARVARVAAPAQPAGSGTREPTMDSQRPEMLEVRTADPLPARMADGNQEALLAESKAAGEGRASGVSSTPESRPGHPTLSAAVSTQAEGARSHQGKGSREGREAVQRGAQVTEDSEETSLSSQGWTGRTSTPTAEVRGAESIQRLGSMERINEVQALEDAKNARMPGRIHLDLLDADGAGTRLRLALRGSQLSGTVDLTDPAATLRMKDRVGELHQALARQGLDASALGLQGVRGAEAGRAMEADLAALLQDPLAGLTRILESRDGSLDTRGERQGAQGDEAQKNAERFRDPARRDRNKEEEK